MNKEKKNNQTGKQKKFNVKGPEAIEEGVDGYGQGH